MFSLLNRTTSSSSLHRSRPSNDSILSPTSSQYPTSPSASLQPSIDGPPSPEHIRAYTEQMKRGFVFTGRTRSHTSSSATPSFRSGSSGAVSGSGDTSSLSRQSSRRSNASSMPVKNGERPESIQIFGKKLFSRHSRKLKYENRSRSSSSLSTNPSLVGETQSAKDYYYDQKRGNRRGTFSASSSSLNDTLKQNISGPYNFQHLTHTRHEQLPNLHRTSRMELATEFSAIRASQAPSNGQLKGIRADDLHFKNFSSEAINTSSVAESDSRPRTSPHRPQTSIGNDSSDLETLRKLTQSKSYESLRAMPPRPLQSPGTLSGPLPPPRTSSRTASMLLGNFDPLAATSLDRPETGSGFRRPKAFHLPTSPPRPITRSESPEDIIVQQVLSPRTPDIDAWPLLSPFDGLQLADVPEEEESYVAARRSRLSSASGELRLSKSVPNLFPQKLGGSRTSVASTQRPQTPAPRILQDDDDENSEIGLALSPSTTKVELSQETWEDDIDYCYEHEAEADCDYEWDQSSTVIDTAEVDLANGGSMNANGKALPSSHIAPLQTSPVRSPPSLLFHSTAQPPNSVRSGVPETGPESPAEGLLRAAHVRSPSRTSSFKESHGFTLSPTLLIPTDFSTQIDQDALYDELLFNDQLRHPGLHMQSQYEPYPVSPVDGHSSTASYRSSGFSRASASTTLSKNGSQESVVLLSRAASVAMQHRSVSSSCSLPDLVHSSRSNRDMPELDLGKRAQQGTFVPSPTPEVLLPEAPRRKYNMGLGADSPVEPAERALSPVMERYSKHSNVPLPAIPGLAHGRKISAPVQSCRGAEAPKGRKRAMSAKSRANNYMLFPQI